MPLATWNSAIDQFTFESDPSANPSTGIGVTFGRLFHLFGSQYASQLFHKAVTFGVIEELMTIAAAATSDSANASLLPAGALILAVEYRVIVAIPTAATFTIGDPTQAARFATGAVVTANTGGVGVLQWNPTVAAATLGPLQTAAAAVRITPNATPGTAVGRVRLVIPYIQFNAPVA